MYNNKNITCYNIKLNYEITMVSIKGAEILSLLFGYEKYSKRFLILSPLKY